MFQKPTSANYAMQNNQCIIDCYLHMKILSDSSITKQLQLTNKEFDDV